MRTLESSTFSTSFAGGIAGEAANVPPPQSMAQRTQRKIEELNRALAVFRDAVPDVKGVVLATDHGVPLAYDLPISIDPGRAAKDAAAAHRETAREMKSAKAEAPASAFIEQDGERILVVFLGGGFVFGGDLDDDADTDMPDWGTSDGGEAIMGAARN